MHGVQDMCMQQWGITLLHDHPTGTQSTQAVFVKGLRKQAVGGADGAGTVNNDHVQTFRCGIFYPLNTVTKNQPVRLLNEGKKTGADLAR